MRILENLQECTGCHACFQICPKNAIEMKPDKRGFLYPEINDEVCIECGLCQKACPLINAPQLNPWKVAYGAYAADKSIHKKSSSGAIFYLLARQVIQNGGVVFGAAMEKDLTVRHQRAETEEELDALRKTKYVQSQIGNTYKQTRDCLLRGRQVLFSGTPCQIAGLKAYLQKDYNSLVTVDLICHGVPSPAVFKRYCSEIFSDKIQNVEFRNKDEGMACTKVVFQTDQGQKIEELYSESPYIKGFIQNLYLRSSCFSCHFKGYERASDLTIGDFWSCKEFYPDLNSDLGTSGVIVHSQKGKDLFNSIQQELTFQKVDCDKLEVWNECLKESTKPNPRSQEFEKLEKEATVKEAVETLTKKPEEKRKSIFNKLRSKLKL